DLLHLGDVILAGGTAPQAKQPFFVHSTNITQQRGVNMNRLFAATGIALAVLVLAGNVLADTNPVEGTWKLNVAKSKYNNAQPPKSQTRTVEGQGKGDKFTFEGVAADGSRISYSFTNNYDGSESPISGTGQPNG